MSFDPMPRFCASGETEIGPSAEAATTPPFDSRMVAGL
jgi:hypothetical protein